MKGFYVGAVVDEIRDEKKGLYVFYPLIRVWDDDNTIISEFFAGPGSSREDVAMLHATEYIEILFDQVKENEY